MWGEKVIFSPHWVMSKGNNMKKKNFKPIESFANTLIVLMTFIIVVRVVMRFFFNKTPSWSEELTALFMVWITMLSFPIGIKENQHLSLTMFYERFPIKVQSFFEIFNSIIIIIFSGFVMFYNGILMVKMTWTSYLASIPVKNATLYIMMPIAGILSVVFVLTQSKLIKKFKKSKIQRSQHGSN